MPTPRIRVAFSASESTALAQFRREGPFELELHVAIACASGGNRLVSHIEEVMRLMKRPFRVGLIYAAKSSGIVREQQDPLRTTKRGLSEQARSAAVAPVRAARTMVPDAPPFAPEILPEDMGGGISSWARP